MCAGVHTWNQLAVVDVHVSRFDRILAENLLMSSKAAGGRHHARVKRDCVRRTFWEGLRCGMCDGTIMIGSHGHRDKGPSKAAQGEATH